MKLDDIIRKVDLAYIDSKINGEVVSDNVTLWLRRLVEELECAVARLEFDGEDADAAYGRGYDEGHSVGEEVGRELGYAEGYDDGYDAFVEEYNKVVNNRE